MEPVKRLFIQLPGNTDSRVLQLQREEYVSEVIDAIIFKFKRFNNVDPEDMHLSKLGDDGSTRIPLKPAQKLSDAGVRTVDPFSTVVVELTAAAAAPAPAQGGSGGATAAAAAAAPASTSGGGSGAATAAVAPATGSNTLIALRSAMMNAEQEGNFIRLAGGAKWPQLGAVPLFVRHFYDSCYTGPLQSVAADEKAKYRKFVILGNAGIGKSAFGSYLLYRAIRDGRTVVYQSFKMRQALVFYADGSARAIAKSAVEDLELLDDAATVFISDSITPPTVEAFTVLITSPNRQRWKDFYNDEKCRRLFFPVYSWDEILQLQKACFPTVEGSVDGVAARFARWGGIPRYVLAKTDEPDQLLLEAALTKPDYSILAEFLGKEELESEAAASHRLLHLKPRGELEPDLPATDMNFYNLGRTELGSSYIADKVCEAIMASSHNQLRALLSLSPRPASASKLYGEVFERAALKALAAGGTFRVRTLQADGQGSETDLVLPAADAPVAGFRTVEVLKAELSNTPAAALLRVLRPTSKSFCAVDYILQGGRPANATVNQAHDLIYESAGDTSAGLGPVSKALGLAKPVDFYWVVPEADFAEWKRPQPVVVKGATASSAQAKKMVSQYALAVPFDLPTSAAVAVSGASASTTVGRRGGAGHKRKREEEKSASVVEGGQRKKQKK